MISILGPDKTMPRTGMLGSIKNLLFHIIHKEDCCESCVYSGVHSGRSSSHSPPIDVQQKMTYDDVVLVRQACKSKVDYLSFSCFYKKPIAVNMNGWCWRYKRSKPLKTSWVAAYYKQLGDREWVDKILTVARWEREAAQELGGRNGAA